MDRDRSLDALKFVLICLVVLGHIIEKDKYTDQSKSVLFSFIYTFHMPLFIFISGYFSKNMTWYKFKKSFKSLAATYIIFQTLYSTWDIIEGTFDIIHFLTVPCNVLWYLACIIIWRFLFTVISRFKIPFAVIASFSIAIAFAMGFVHDINGVLMRAVTFFPFFVLGYYCASGVIKRIQSLKKIYTAIGLLLVLIITYLVNNNWFILSLFLSAPYDNFPDMEIAVIHRVLIYLLAFLASVCVINLSTLVTDIFYKFGSRTLDVYLLHPFWVYLVYNIFVLDYLLNVEHTWLITDVFASIIIIIACLFFAKFKIMQVLIDPVRFFGKRKISPAT